MVQYEETPISQKNVEMGTQKQVVVFRIVLLVYKND
jgi:hypothetical protein